MPQVMNNQFPILCLSSIPLECVASQLMFKDIFQFSTISKDCFDAMKDALRSTPKSRRMYIHLLENKLQLTLYADKFHNGGVSETVEWNFNGTCNRRRPWNVELYSGPQPKTLVFREESSGHYVTASNSVEELLQFAEHIANLFRAFTYQIVISPEYCRFLPAIQRVPVLHQTRELRVGEGIVSHDTMLRLLTGFQTRLLCIKCDAEPNFQFNGPISTEELALTKCSWFTAPLFHAYNGDRLFLSGCFLTATDVNTFLRNWKASHSRSWPKLQLTRASNRDPELQRRWDEERWYFAKITEGLEDISHGPVYPFSDSYRTYKRQTDGMILDLHIHCFLPTHSGWMSMTFGYSSK